MSLLPPNEEGPSQGARAGQSGTSLERIVEAVFSARKVRPCDYNSSFDYGPEYQDMWKRKDKLLVRQVRIKGWKVDFLYIDFRRDLRVPIECKQQLGGGTTDEKLPHVVDKLVGCGCVGFWLVLGGGGFSPKMVHVVQNKIEKLSGQHKMRGHLVFNEGPFLQRAVERLVERGEI
jgi:hypothetical protein